MLRHSFLYACIAVFILTLSGCFTKTTENVLDPSAPHYKRYRIDVPQKGNISDSAQDFQKQKEIHNKAVADGAKKSKEWRVALLVPSSGKEAKFGQQVLDAVTMALFDRESDNIKIIPFDVGDDAQSAIDAAKEAVDIGVDIAIGPIFSNTSKAVAPIFKQADIKVISISNNVALMGTGVNIFGIVPEAMAMSVFSYAKSIDKHNTATVLPSNRRGFAMGKKIEELANKLEIDVIHQEYYPSNTELFGSVAKRINLNYKTRYRQGKDGKLYLNNFRQLRELDKESQEKKQEKTKDDKFIESVMQSLYIDAAGAELYTLLGEMNKVGLLNKNIILLSNDAIVDDVLNANHYADGIIFASTSTGDIGEFERKFERTFHYKPIKIASLAYDAATTIFKIIKENNTIDDAIFYSENGFSGIYGDFRFTNAGIVQRRFNIYRVKNRTLELIGKSPNFI
jgi:hypothetical protein